MDRGSDKTREEGDHARRGCEVSAIALFRAIAAARREARSCQFVSTTRTDVKGTTVSGVIQFGSDGAERAMLMTMDAFGAGARSQVLMVDGQFYVAPTERVGIPRGSSWIKLHSGTRHPSGLEMTGAFDAIGSGTDLTARLAEHPNLLTVMEMGTEAIDDVETTKYTITVNDVTAFTADTDAPLERLTFTLWVDGDNLPRRHTADVDGSASVDTTYSNYGVDVDVEAPPADEVIDMSELMNQQDG